MCKNGKTEICTTEEYLPKMTELAEKAKLICLSRERATITFIGGWKPLDEEKREK